MNTSVSQKFWIVLPLSALTVLFPIFIVDGGRMFQIAAKRLLKKEESANKALGFMGFLFLLILVLALGKTYFPF